MITFEYFSNNEKFSLELIFKTNTEKKLRVFCSDYGKKNSNYCDRKIIVNGQRKIKVTFPVSPKKLIFYIYNVDNKKDKDIQVLVNKIPFVSYVFAYDNDDKEFIQFAINFAQICGFTNATNNGVMFFSKNNKFKIRFLNKIIDREKNVTLNTPARVGHSSGVIEVSKQKFDKYTIPMRLVILLHEYSHAYKNNKIGYEKGYESGADINGLYFYLGLGFSKIDAINVFGYVFLNASTDENVKRLKIINDYIKEFENEKYAQKIIK
ncbi:MAG: hypothetical protein QXM96_00260 [Candidatus Woesearchaeota archaeon]